MKKPIVIYAGTGTKITAEKYRDIIRILQRVGESDFYLMPSLLIWLLPAGSFPPFEDNLPGTFMGRFNAGVGLKVLSEELTYAIEESCFPPELAVTEEKPEPSRPQNAARLSTQSVVTVDGVECTLAEHARRRGVLPKTLRNRIASQPTSGAERLLRKKCIPGQFWTISRFGTVGRRSDALTRAA